MTQVSIRCYVCNKQIQKELKKFNEYQKHKWNFVCSDNCKHAKKRVNTTCKQCNAAIQKPISATKKVKNLFCSCSCAATFNNTHKTKGTRVSKLELFIQTKLKENYPNLEFYFNQTDAINSELDVYIPSLKLAFELNGIFHYEPIYGSEKLNQTQNNDNRKFQACLERGIELCIINSSSMKKFSEKRAIPYYEIIKNLVNQKLDCAEVANV